jgi:hypothetical protein
MSAFRNMVMTAHMQARLAVAIYGGREAVAKLADDVGARFRWLESASVNAAALVFDDHVHVSVAGSNDIHDWVQNIAANQERIELMSAHAGFVVASRWILREIKRSDFMEITKGKRLYLGGHSAGGCIAMLLAIDPLMTPDEVFTFGSPRVFSQLSAAIYSAFGWEVRRFVMDGDPVPGLPLRKFRWLYSGANYAHESAPLLIDDLGSIRAYEGMSLAEKAWSMTKTSYLYGATLIALAMKWLPAMLADHEITRYRDALERSVRKVQ